MLAIIQSASLLGVEGRRVRAEVHVGKGLPTFSMVGLPDAACREARDRVRAAVMSSEYDWPVRRLTINLAPSSFPKLGTSLDLAIAVGILAATGEVPAESTDDWALVAELGLDGSLRPVRGMVPLVASLRGRLRGVIVADAAAAEAALVPGVEIRCAPDLGTVVRALRGETTWSEPPDAPQVDQPPPPDLADVRGQPAGRRVVEIAAAGGHHLLLSGPPGAGKTMLASRLPGLLPDLDDEAALEVTSIHSAAGMPVAGRLLRRPPYRAPHHTASAVSLIGGGSGAMRPGEISLAHRGVLFADELGEFPPTVLDAMRQPIEEGRIRVSRARGTVAYPARFQFVAASNPCPCGPEPTGCRCSEAGLARYARRLSGPLLDRFDLRLHVGRPDPSHLLGLADGEPTAVVARRVAVARDRAAARGLGLNATLSGHDLDAVAPLEQAASTMLEGLVRQGRLTARGVQRVRRVARTIADLDDHDGILSVDHVASAVALRVPSGSDLAGAR